jgi:hypothetical protein
MTNDKFGTSASLSDQIRHSSFDLFVIPQYRNIFRVSLPCAVRKE